MSDRLSPRVPLVIVALALLVIFYRLLLGETLFWGLPTLQFYPWRDFALEMLRGGQLPLWNPYNGAGAPLIANYQSALFYPLNWPGTILPLAFATSITAVLHLFIAAWGMWAFTGRLGLPALGRGVSALSFGLTGYLVARLGTYPIVSTAAWIPWVMWAALGVLIHKRARNVGLLALLAALQLLAGHAQTAWYSMLLIGLFALYWLITHRDKGWWQGLLLVGAGLTLAAGIAAVQLWPTAELLGTSQRSDGVDFDFAMNFSYGPARGLNFLAPNVFGNPGNGSYLTEGAFFEDAVYSGLLPLMAAIAAVISWIKRRIRNNVESPAFFVTVPFWLVIAIISFVFALGQNTPIFPFLFRNIPTFDLFQAPVRWHIWTVFALSVLAGIGTQAWGRGHWLFFSTRLATAGCVGAALLAYFVAPTIIAVDDPDTMQSIQVLINAVVLTAVLGAGAGALTLLQPERDSSRYPWWALAVLLFVAVDLGWAAQGLNPTVPAEFYDRQDTDYADRRAYWPEAAEREIAFETWLLFDDYRVATENWREFRSTELPNLNLLDRWSLLNNFEPLQVGHVADYIDLIEGNPTSAPLQAAGVSAVYDDDGRRTTLAQPATRAWFVESVCWHGDEANLTETLTDSNWNPLRQVHLMGEGDCPDLVEDSLSPGTVVAIEDSANSVNLIVETESGGWLLLADTDYPGWTVTIDEQPAAIMRANLAFRALEVPAGTETVQFDYRPAWLLPGAIITLAALVVALALLRLRKPS